MGAFITVLFDGVAYGSLLFVISVGMSVTMGLMSFINLAHGAFAMFGGYAAIWLIHRCGVPFAAALPVVLIAFAVIGGLTERLYRLVSRERPLDQVLFTIGLALMATSIALGAWSQDQQKIELPQALEGQLHIGGVDLLTYRLFLIAIVVAITIALQLLVKRTKLGAQLRAAVDNPHAAAGLGIPVNWVFTISFGLGSGLAALGGALGVRMIGLDPSFPFKYMVYFLMVVVVGGEGSIVGSAVAALGLGVFDVVGKYYIPSIGGFLIYGLMVILLLIFPRGLFGARR